MKTKSELFQLKVFLILTFSFTTLMAVLAHYGYEFGLPFIILIPAIFALIIHKFIGGGTIFKKNTLGIRLGKLKYLIISPMVLFAISTLIYLITFVLFPDVLYSYEEIASNTAETGKTMGFETGSTILNIIIIFALNILVAPVLNIIIMLGEEIGWRAFMVPRLMKLYPKSGLIIGGAIWGIWHAPMIIFQGLNYPDTPILGIFIMILLTIPLGIILQYLYIKSGSVFAVALAHGSLNWTATTFMSFFIVKENMNYLLHGPTGIIGIIIFDIIGFYLIKKIYRLESQKPETNHIN